MEAQELGRPGVSRGARYESFTDFVQHRVFGRITLFEGNRRPPHFSPQAARARAEGSLKTVDRFLALQSRNESRGHTVLGRRKSWCDFLRQIRQSPPTAREPAVAFPVTSRRCLPPVCRPRCAPIGCAPE